MLLPIFLNSVNMKTEYLNQPQKSSPTNTTYWNLLTKSASSALAAASAMSLNILCLMWMKTTMNYQYRHGGGFVSTVSLLFHQADKFRLYRGIIPALIMGPLYRFGDVAANMLAINASQQSM